MLSEILHKKINLRKQLLKLRNRGECHVSEILLIIYFTR